MSDYRQQFIQFALDHDALKFGQFTLKSGRVSPYFFNAGAFSTGEALGAIGKFYAEAILASGVEFDVIFGPAYKGIPLAAATSIALAEKTGKAIPWVFNRKEVKDHGEGGSLVGAPLAGRVLIIDYCGHCDSRITRSDQGGGCNCGGCQRHDGPSGTWANRAFGYWRTQA